MSLAIGLARIIHRRLTRIRCGDWTDIRSSCHQDWTDPDYALLDKWNGHKEKDGNYHYHSTKTYHITVFALSDTLTLSAGKSSRADLLIAVRDITLAETTLSFE